jgi:hypothetical protein
VYEVIWEGVSKVAGDLTDLAEQLVNIKDQLFLKELLVPQGQDDHVRFLRDIDGLTSYWILGIRETSIGTEIIDYATPDDYWPFFKTRNNVLAISKTSNRIIDEYSTHLNHLVRLRREDRLLVAERRCPEVVLALGLKYEDLLISPMVQAVLQAVTTFEREDQWAQNQWEAKDGTRGWYDNRDPNIK